MTKAAPKGYNLLARTADERQAHYDAMERMRDRFQRKAERRFALALRHMVDEAATAVRNGFVGSADTALDFATARVETAIKDTYEEVVIHFAGIAYNFLESATKNFTDAEVEAWLAQVNVFLATGGADKIVAVTETTKAMVRRVMIQATAEGWGPDKAARELRSTWAGLEKIRAERIARTELVGASNFGNDMGARSLAEANGLVLEKVWIATLDGRTRDTHLALNNSQVAQSDVFANGLAFPGDPNSSDAAEVVNCRCAQAYVVIE